MARLIAIGQAVNDGERRVLRTLKAGLPDDWLVVANFEVPGHNRMFEVDALALAPAGWAYVIETKELSGQIEGNDKQWRMPSKTGGEVWYYRPNPVPVVRRNVKKLASFWSNADQALADIRIYPLVVLVSELEPSLEGNSADAVVLIRGVVDRILRDPRPAGHAPVGGALLEEAERVLVQAAEPLRPPNTVNDWQLCDLVDRASHFEVWAARNPKMGQDAPTFRLKRFVLDSLATGRANDQQQQLARRDLAALVRLNGADGVVPFISTVEEDDASLAVVTAWPSGPSLEVVKDGRLSVEDAVDVVDALATALASVHDQGIVHRALTPSSAHLLGDGKVVLTDFDFSRIPGDSSVTKYLPDDFASDYSAPEVRADPGRASFGSDVWSLAAIALEICGRSLDLKDLHGSTRGLPDELSALLERSLAVEPSVRPVDAGAFVRLLRGASSSTAPAAREGFQPNDVLSNRWVVRSRSRSGGIADVYRVNDTDLDEEYAAKFLREEFDEEDDRDVGPIAEYKRVKNVPPHSNLALPVFLERLESYERDGVHYQFRRRFLLTRWIEGSSLLDELRVGRIPVARVVAVVSQLAAALEHLHAHGLYHRDVKPGNVIVNSEGDPVLVDFNISVKADAAGNTNVGTPAYLPPNLATAGWSPASDTYMLALTCADMLAGEPLGRDRVGRWLATAAVHEAVRGVLDDATNPSTMRFETAAAFSTALTAAAEQDERAYVVRESPPERVPASTNHNPYRDEINRLFSQSRASNAGTRGLDDFGRWTYIETKIDRELTAAVLGHQYRLILITGNAGDGKTAFIQTVETHLRHRGAVDHGRSEGNGAVLELDGQRFETNWDGSQDEGATDNDEVLAAFFGPYAGHDPDPRPGETRIIAINEGRLLDFVAHPDRRRDFAALCTTLDAMMRDTSYEPPDWLLVVNLNLRALTIPAVGQSQDVVGATLDRFVDERLWSPCVSCRVRSDCYAHANATLLRDPVFGPRATERIRQVLDVVRLRRRLHITMRDLRSALAFLVAGNRSCGEIADLVDADDAEALLAGRVYNALFGATSDVAARGDPSARRDRLLAAVAPLDPGRTASPAEDVRLWVAGAGALPSTFERVIGSDHSRLDLLFERARENFSQTWERRVSHFAHGSLRRIQFLIRDGTTWATMLPYRRMAEFEALLLEVDAAALDQVVQAVSFSEGLYSERFRGDLAVRLASDNESASRSYVRHPSSAFVLQVLNRSEEARFVEYAPDTLVLRLVGFAAIELEVDLDLFETLGRIIDGFVPSREEMRGTWLNLGIFKDQLASIPTDELLLSDDDNTFYEIRREMAGERLEIMPVPL